MLDGLIILDSLGNLDELKDEIEEISRHTGLQVIKRREVGLEVKGHATRFFVKNFSYPPPVFSIF